MKVVGLETYVKWCYSGGLTGESWVVYSVIIILEVIRGICEGGIVRVVRCISGV